MLRLKLSTSTCTCVYIFCFTTVQPLHLTFVENSYKTIYTYLHLFYMRKFYALIFLMLPLLGATQEKWDLKRCVEYAMKNNVSVKQADIEARTAALQFQQNKLAQYPGVNFSTSAGLQFGKSIDPTTNQFTTEPFFFQDYQLGGRVQLIGWNRLNNTTKGSEFMLTARLAGIEKAANDIALNVATYYLQTLASLQQIEINKVQIAQTKIQYNNTRARVDAGALPELNFAEVDAQLAADSANLIAAETQYSQNLLLLKGLLNLDPATPFDIETPDIENIPLENLADLEPAVVYAVASTSFPQQKMYANLIKGAEYNTKAAKAALYPSISGGYGLSTTFNNKAYEIVGGALKKMGYASQVERNFQQNISTTLSVPLFNNGTYRTAYKNSLLNLESYQLDQYRADLQLKQDIYTAHNNAIAAMKKYYASKKSVESAQKAYDFAQKRWDVGLLTTSDLLTTQNRLLNAKLQELSNQIDYVFRIKLLEFYKGNGLKL